ncbi:hypothetical protein [Photobacterium damselae]
MSVWLATSTSVIFFLIMMRFSCYQKPRWQQGIIVFLQVVSVSTLIHLVLEQHLTDFLYAKWYISLFFSAVFILSAVKDIYESKPVDTSAAAR